MKFNQIHHNDTTCYSNSNENTGCRSMLVKLYIQIASFWPKLSSWSPLCPRLMSSWSPTDHHSWSPLTLCWLRARDPGPGPNHCGVLFAFCTIATKKYKWERKTWKKHSFSDGKRFTDFVLLRCFIDFQTTLVDSGNLVIFSTFW
jgi:hypothetical protein